MNAPCKDCKDRNPGCHDKCDKYLEYKKSRDELSEMRQKALEDYYATAKKRKYQP